MTDKYIENCTRTESPNFHPVNQFFLRQVMADFVVLGNALDNFKKAIFYGKNLDLYQNGPVGTGPFVVEDKNTQRMIHAILGAATEATELVAQLYDHLFEGQELDCVNVIEEFGDIDWYKAIACDVVGVGFHEPIDRVIEKLKRRYPEKFTEKNAIERNLKKEREALET